MIPGEYLLDTEAIELNSDRPSTMLEINNTGDRPIQIGSHFHFFEINRAILCDRPAAYGMRLDIPAGTAVRIEPGEIKTVRLIPMAGLREMYGGSGLVNGQLDDKKNRATSMERLKQFQAGELPCVADLKQRGTVKTKKR